jgi:rhodanese-related sulfurtransferase
MKTSIRIAVVMAVITALAACSSTDAPTEAPAFEGQHVGAAAFALAVESPGVTVVDVRTPEEFASGHLPGSVNIDVSAATFAAEIAALDPDATYAVYCRSGNRSRTAIDLMTSAGVAQTVGLEGGIGAWTGDIVTG